MREAAGAWTETYPVMEHRHDPIGISGPSRVAWWFGDPAAVPSGLADKIARTDGQLVALGRDPLADLVVVLRLTVTLGGRAGSTRTIRAIRPVR